VDPNAIGQTLSTRRPPRRRSSRVAPPIRPASRPATSSPRSTGRRSTPSTRSTSDEPAQRRAVREPTVLRDGSTITISVPRGAERLLVAAAHDGAPIAGPRFVLPPMTSFSIDSLDYAAERRPKASPTR
jgi:hypothetical protein